MPWAILRSLGYDDELEWEVRRKKKKPPAATPTHPFIHQHPPQPITTIKQAPADWSALEDAFLARVYPEDSWELTPDALRFLGRVFDEWAVAESVEEGDGDGRRVLGPEEVGH